MTTLEFVRREYWGADAWEYFFQPDAAVEYLAGQYASFFIDGISDARGAARTFTMTSLASDSLLSFAVKISPNPSSYKTRLSALRPGEKILMREAMGDLVMPRTTNTPLLFIAGGLGIASYIALLHARASGTEPSSPVSLLWGLRSQSEQYSLPILSSIAPMDQQVFIAPDRLAVDDIMKRATPDTLIYLSGSEHFVSSLRSDLHAHGITDARILFDYFSGYKEL